MKVGFCLKYSEHLILTTFYHTHELFDSNVDITMSTTLFFMYSRCWFYHGNWDMRTYILCIRVCPFAYLNFIHVIIFNS